MQTIMALHHIGAHMRLHLQEAHLLSTLDTMLAVVDLQCQTRSRQHSMVHARCFTRMRAHSHMHHSWTHPCAARSAPGAGRLPSLRHGGPQIVCGQCL